MASNGRSIYVSVLELDKKHDRIESSLEGQKAGAKAWLILC